MSREKIQEKMREKIDDREKVDLPELAEEVVQELAEDEEFTASFFKEFGYDVAYGAGAQVLAATRREMHRTASGAISAERAEERARELGTRFSGAFRGSRSFARWMEHDGMDYYRLKSMNAEQLQKAANQRLKRAETEKWTAGFLQRLAEGLPEGQTVGDVYSEEDLERIYENREDAA